MDNSGLTLNLIFAIAIGWFCILLIIISLWVLKGDFKSHCNYRPWKPFIVPEDVADRVNRECAKWLLLLAVITFFVLIFGVIYGVRTGNYYTIPFTILPILLGLFILLGVGAYIYSWYLLQQRNKRKG
jgi:hypothetical protein